MKMHDGVKRDIDSALEPQDGQCVTTIHSAQRGYARPMPANECS
ncbi:hypothetical protein [Caballeronia sp. TF1N1]|nr:hypothetical protein [Caballeronia sp. TF1N1]